MSRMFERLAALLAEHAETLAGHDGVPVAVRHVHAAAHQLGEMLRQVKDTGIVAFQRPLPGASATDRAEWAPASGTPDPSDHTPETGSPLAAPPPEGA